MEGLRQALVIGGFLGGMTFLWVRGGLLGHTRIDLYKGDIKIGVFDRFFYSVAKWRIAGDAHVTEEWSVSPIEFNEKWWARDEKKY